MRPLTPRFPLVPLPLAHPQLLGFAIGIAVFGLLGGRPRLWDVTGPTILFGSTTALVLIGLAGVVASFWQDRSASGARAPVAPPAIQAVCLATGAALAFISVFLSDWLVRGQSLFKGPFCRPEAIVVAGFVWYLAHHSRRWYRKAILLLPLVGSALAIAYFLAHANGRTLVADDHAVFIYRLQLLKEQFPHIPFYYPLWNAGIDARDFFASGSLNVFLLFYPIIATCDLWQCYTVIVALALFVVPPLSVGYAARILRLSKPTAAIAATLAIAPSLLWFRWGLKYGTMGFVVSTGLAPLCWALWFRIAQRTKPLSWGIWLATLLVTTLVAFWSLAPIAIAPIALAFFFDGWRSIVRPRVLALFAALLAVNLPWMLLFVTVSRVTSFIGAEQTPMTTVATSGATLATDQAAASTKPSEQKSPAFRHRAGAPSARQSIHHLRTWGISLHPLLFIFGPIGILLLRRRLALLYTLQCGWLLSIGTLLVSMKPQLELDRMLVVLAIFLCIPAAVALRTMMRTRVSTRIQANPFIQRWRNYLSSSVALLVFSFVVLTPFYACFISQNRTLEHFHFADETYDIILNTINHHAGEGRILFSGQVLHELDEGHFAPLTILTQRPMIASSQVHNLWSYKQVVPAEFMARGDEGIEEYLSLMNVSLVFAHDPVWRRWFESHPERYTSVLKGPPFAAFARRQERASYFVEGSGIISRQDTDGVTFVPASSEGVLSFTWFPFLQSSRCSIAPHAVSTEVTFIRYTGSNPGEPVTLSAVSPIRRLLHR